MTDRLVDEILGHIRRQSQNHAYGLSNGPSRISFVGHSLGCILVRSAIAQPKIKHMAPRFHTFLRFGLIYIYYSILYVVL